VCYAMTPPGAGPGAPCGAPVACAPGLLCASGGGRAPVPPPPCIAGAGAGAPCDSRQPECAPGLACAASDDGKTWTCMPTAKLGEPCTSLFQCGAQYQLSDIICDVNGTHTCVHAPSTGPCVAQVGFDATGAGSCDPLTSYCDSGTCMPVLAPGAPCIISNLVCGVWGDCYAGRCRSMSTPPCTPK
jgi:hypothetical protein